MSGGNIERDSYHTPRRVQKCLFGTDSPTKHDDLSDESNTEMGQMLPETPERQFGTELQNSLTETPNKNKEIILTTPLTSKQKINLLPRLHRRKSLNVLDLIESLSPNKKENTLKRHATEELQENTVKLLKTNENHSVSKARAALFQDKDYEAKLKNITLNPKSFYSNSNQKTNYKMLYKLLEPKLQRKSFTGHVQHYKKSARRHTIGEINGGVSHGIKKPKSKSNVKKINNSPDTINNSQNSKNKQLELLKEVMDTPNVITIHKTPPPEIDHNKRFFKNNSLHKENTAAVVTISNNIKLKIISNNKVELSQKKSQHSKEAHKRAKPVNISFDTTDLMEDEPELEKTVEQNKIENILKILENDWADDDYDSMDSLVNNIAHVSPLKPVAVLKDVAMSPASEITTMTSSMNIKDISTPKTSENILMLDNNKKSDENEPEHQYYPLFSKGYSANKVLSEIDKPTRNVKGNKNWQLSLKLNGGQNQYQIDAGQKNFGATQCPECGVIYQIGEPEDENAHLNYHNNRKILKFPGWKSERVLMEDVFTSSRIILLEPSDSKQYWKKVTDILTYVDRDLGLADTKLSNYEQKRVYLYIRDKAVIGVLVAEHVTTAYRMIPDLLDFDCCSAESSPVKCGINVVWTDMNHRKQGIATKLVDILRSNFYFGYVMSLDDIAFSIPTQGGKKFAEKYTKTRNFKVYS